MRRIPPEQLWLEVEHLEPPTVAPAEPPTTPEGARRKKRAGPAADERHPAGTELLQTAGALLTRSHLRELGLERRAVDAVFRALPVVALPGYSRPMIRAEDFLALLESHTFRDDRVRPTRAA